MSIRFGFMALVGLTAALAVAGAPAQAGDTLNKIKKAGKVDVIDSLPFYTNSGSAGSNRRFMQIVKEIFKGQF